MFPFVDANQRVFHLSAARAMVRGRHGYFLVNRHDQYVGKAIEMYGEYGEEEARFLQSLVSAGDCIVEVGANIGACTIPLARAVGPSGRIYAYEPQVACFALLQTQAALNEFDQTVIVRQQGCGAAPGIMWHTPQDYEAVGNFGGVSLLSTPVQNAPQVEVVRLDDMHGGESVRLIKIDAEGMEAEVLRGATEIIREQKPILYVENDRPEKSDALIALVLGFDYKAWWHISRLFDPQNFFGVSDNIYGRLVSINMICVPADSEFTYPALPAVQPRGRPPLA